MGEDATLEALVSTGRDFDLLFDNIGNGDIPAAIIPARSARMAWSASAAAGSTLAIRARSAAASPPIETPSEPRVGLFPSLADLLASHGHLGGRAASGDAQSRDTFGGAASLDNFISAPNRAFVAIPDGRAAGGDADSPEPFADPFSNIADLLGGDGHLGGRGAGGDADSPDTFGGSDPGEITASLDVQPRGPNDYDEGNAAVLQLFDMGRSKAPRGPTSMAAITSSGKDWDDVLKEEALRTAPKLVQKPWSQAEVVLVAALRKKHGNAWSTIEKDVPDRSAASIAHLYSRAKKLNDDGGGTVAAAAMGDERTGPEMLAELIKEEPTTRLTT